MDKIKNIIFDLGGVLIDWNPRYVFKDYFMTEEATEHFLKHICSPEWNEKQDAGRTFADATIALIAEFPHYDAEIRQYYGRWEDMLADDLPDTVQLLGRLLDSGTYRVLALTNWSEESFPVALAKFDFLHKFEGILVSGTERLAKPDPAIFHLMCERYDLIPSQTIFIDDNIRNVDSANQLGFHAIHFLHAEDLRTQLVTRGVTY